MKLFLKIGKLLAILILTVSVILISASFLLKDKVGFIILRSLNKNLSTRLEVGSYRLSFLKKFPRASLELHDVVVHSSPGFNSREFSGINTDTLLSSRSVTLDFKLTDILKGNYTIERIGARAGKANFFTDSAGRVNYNISVNKNGATGNQTVIDLKRINLSGINSYYNSRLAHLIIKGTIKTGRLKSRISGSNIDFTAGTEMQINGFQLFNYSTPKPVAARLDLELQSSKNGIRFRKGILHIEKYDLGITGFVASDNMLDLDVTGTGIDLSTIKDWLPEKYLKKVSDYDPSGTIKVAGKIKGLLNRASNPHIEIGVNVTDGRISYKKSKITLKELSFTGHFSNGPRNRPESGIVTVSGFSTKLGSSTYTGSATLRELKNPVVDLSLKGRAIPGELVEFFDLKNISTADGFVDLDLRLINSLWSDKSFSIAGLIDMKPQGTLAFNSFSLGLNNNKTLVSNVTGDLIMQNSIEAKNIHLNYKGQNIKIAGDFINLPEWITGKKVRLKAKADVSFDRLIPETFFTETSSSAKSGHRPRAFSLPDDINLDVNFRIDSLTYKTFSSSKIEGTLNFQPKVITFNTLKMRSLKGLISGSCFVAQNSNKSFVARGSFVVTNIDVNKAFTSFHNFGQSFLKAENIKGTLSGSLSLLFPLDSLLNFHINTLTAEGKYYLVSGALINFDPVKQLSSFIELSELENISFDKLENDFFIRNNYLYVPQMEVKSSAADLSVNGRHSFDNDYEYHVRILLSQILSRKRIKNKSGDSEFGVVEDDGLGRTSLLLKILGKGEVAKVSYDMKAAGTEVRSDIKKERKTLKTILNQEYGWYKNDSAISQKPVEKKTRFRITWDDGDTVKATPPAVVKKKKTE